MLLYEGIEGKKESSECVRNNDTYVPGTERPESPQKLRAYLFHK
jgi:hypothetical protein